MKQAIAIENSSFVQMGFVTTKKRAKFITEIGNVKIENALKLYDATRDYNEQDSIEFKNGEDTRAELMKEHLCQIHGKFKSEVKSLIEEGVSSEILSKVISSKMEWEAYKLDDK